MFDPEELREIADKDAPDPNGTDEIVIQIIAEEIDKFVLDLEGHVQEFAEDHYRSFDWQAPEGTDDATVLAVARAFKNKHSKLMVITSLGTRNIKIDWSGKHEC